MNVLLRCGALLFVVSGAFMACAPSVQQEAWSERWLTVERAHVHGDYASALENLQTLESTAGNSRDRHEVRIRRGDCLASMGHSRRAMEAWFHAAREAPSRESAAHAYLRVARWMADQPGMKSRGSQAMIRLLDGFPDTRAGKRALDHVIAVMMGTDDGKQRLPSFLAKRFRLHRKTALAKFLVFEESRLLMNSETRRDWERAVLRLADLEQWFPDSALWDDAVYARSEVLHRLERYPEELDALRALLSHRRKGLLGGVSETAYYHRSQWRIAQVLHYDLGQLALAELALEHFVREYSFSSRFDDALYELAVVRLGRGSLRGAEEALERLALERPESRFNRHASLLLETGMDPRTRTRKKEMP
jgi:tetratricopeptide (TPR) repeat protein